MAVGAAQPVDVVYAQPLQKRVIHAVEFDPLVSQQQRNVFAHLHHGAEVGAAQSVAVEPEFEPAESAVHQRVERHDADMGVGQSGPVVEPLGIIILYIEIHRPRHPFVHRAVERFDPFAFVRVAEEHRVGEYIVGRAQLGETFVLREKVDSQKIAIPPPHLFQQARQFVGQCRAVAQNRHRRRRCARRACPADVVAEILLHGHRQKVESGFVEVAQEAVEFFEGSHRQGFYLQK